MNKLVLYLLLACMALARDTYAQSITLSVNNASLDTVFARIQSQTPYRFVYTNEELVGTKRISLSVQKAPVETVLSVIFKDQPVDYSREEQYIYVQKKQENKSGNAFVDRAVGIRGKVGDSLGSPLAGASIQLRGAKRGIQTDANGAFQLTGLQAGDVIQVTFTGYLAREIKFTNQTYLNVVLIRSASPLDEIQIVAYGKTTQRTNTGSAVRVDGKTISDQPLDNPINALAGKVPGLFVQSGQGLPGTFTNVQLRGIGSVAAGTVPLYIIDGIPFSGYALNNNTTVNGASNVIAGYTNASGLLSPFSSLNPSDIESVEVLKDADATAIYGSRGANGVILITTKHGSIGKTAGDVKVYQGWQAATHIVKGLNTTQFLQLDREAYVNDKVTPTPTIAPELFVWDSTKSVDYQKKILGSTSNITNADISLSGGTAGTRFLFNGNYFKEGTIFPGSYNYSRGGGHLSVDHNSIDGKFNATFSASYSADVNNTLGQSIASFNYYPNYPLYDSTGKLNWATSNYLGIMKETSKASTQNMFANGMLSYTLLNALKIKIDAGYNKVYINGTTIYPLESSNPAYNPVNKAIYANNSISSFIAEPQAEYSKKIQKHKITLLGGGSYQYQFTQGSIIAGQNYSNEALLQNIGAAGSIATFPAPQSSYTQYKYASVFGRTTYDFSDRYIVNASFRRDGSSRFGPGRKYGNFGALGVAWVFSNEKFVKNPFPWLSFGKIRGSYGTVGNDQIADYQYLATYSTNSTYQSTSSLAPSRLANPNYSWEVTKKLEGAIELGFLRDRILITAAWFRNRSNNQLTGYPLPTQTGFSSYQANLPATVQNSGEEFSFTSVIIKSKHFTWSTTGNISFIKNVLVSYPNLTTSSYKNTYVVGQSLSIKKGFAFDGINASNGLPEFRTSKGQDTVSPAYFADYVVLGKTMPDFYGGLSNTFSYRGFEFGFTIQFVKQQGAYPSYWPGMAGFTGYMPPESMDRWTHPGQITSVPRSSTTIYEPVSAQAYQAWFSSSRFWGDASYVRLKSASLSYSFDQGILSKVHLARLRFFAEGQNLFTLTKYTGTDPENPAGTLIAPQLRTLVFGIQVTQ